MRATGHRPYPYQARLARDGLPAVVQAPTGTGKTAVVLAWLWRRLHGPDPRAVPRRLVFALPQRALVEQVVSGIEAWLSALGLTDDVAVHVAMGGAGDSQSHWRMALDRPAIVVGTVDSLVSKALNRGYGLGRSMYPIDFALVTNGAHWVVDEFHLCPESTATLRQIAAFTDPNSARSWPTAEPFGLTCMSATLSTRGLDTVDNPWPADGGVVRIEPDERTGPLAARLAAGRTVHRVPAEPGDYAAVAATVRARHRAGSLTLVVVNTVAAARAVHTALSDGPTPTTLLHSRFRGVERHPLIAGLLDRGDGRSTDDRIIVSTQVVGAGVDLNAAVLVTEAASWPSTVRRAGRCNRTGLVPDAELWWLPPAQPAPYGAVDVAAAVEALTALDGVTVTGEDLLDAAVAWSEPAVTALRRPDLLALFDTAPDLAGAEVDVAPYVGDGGDLDVQVAWARWTPADGSGRPPADARTPDQPWRCLVPVGEVRMWARTVPVWRYDPAADRWTSVTDRAPARPGETVLVAAESGGYDPRTGFDPRLTVALGVECPVLDARPEPAATADPPSAAEEPFAQDDARVARSGWLALAHHSEDVRDHARALLAGADPDLAAAVRRAVEAAGYAHDLGKWHPIWQDALCALAPNAERAYVEAGRPWAKSGINAPLAFAGGVPFRHELASLLLLDGPLGALLDDADDRDLARYLVLAHHGVLRMQVRGPRDTDESTLLGLTHGAAHPVPPLLGQPAGTLIIDLAPFSPGGDASWTRTALALRDRYGPFVLAYLETLVRMADWRASESPTPRN